MGLTGSLFGCYVILDLRLVFLHNSSYTYKFYGFFMKIQKQTRNGQNVCKKHTKQDIQMHKTNVKAKKHEGKVDLLTRLKKGLKLKICCSKKKNTNSKRAEREDEGIAKVKGP